MSNGEWVVCPECGKLVFWESSLFQWKVEHEYILLCSHECGIKFFPKHPELNHGVQEFMKLLKDGIIIGSKFVWDEGEFEVEDDEHD